ncbi:MAG TPA: twin-arginine translocase TatA/TatE family subunit [Candidatus Olsenella excrementigallinarum]|nr:twin-arginine translocase TatA/TatE family subunit [Candidatus Olsenella excrementigallinarum]
MIFGMGPMELAVILLVVLVIFGPKNLPKLGSALGKTVKNVREGMEDELPADEVDQPSSDEADQR